MVNKFGERREPEQLKESERCFVNFFASRPIAFVVAFGRQ